MICPVGQLEDTLDSAKIGDLRPCFETIGVIGVSKGLDHGFRVVLDFFSLSLVCFFALFVGWMMMRSWIASRTVPEGFDSLGVDRDNKTSVSSKGNVQI